MMKRSIYILIVVCLCAGFSKRATANSQLNKTFFEGERPPVLLMEQKDVIKVKNIRNLLSK